MAAPLPSISAVSPLKAIESVARAAGGSGGFEGILKDAIHKVEDFRGDAAQKIEQFLNGESDDLHQTIMSAQRAELAFDLFLQARNKVVQAYQEVMRMQL
ncbi:MAG: flagellar hook-basal body complex protein FliE [Bryobacteraceae bacterium]